MHEEKIDFFAKYIWYKNIVEIKEPVIKRCSYFYLFIFIL